MSLLRASFSFAAAAWAFSLACWETVMYVRPISSASSRPGGTEGPVDMAEVASSLASNSSTQFRKAKNRFVLMNWSKC